MEQLILRRIDCISHSYQQIIASFLLNLKSKQKCAISYLDIEACRQASENTDWDNVAMWEKMNGEILTYLQIIVKYGDIISEQIDDLILLYDKYISIEQKKALEEFKNCMLFIQARRIVNFQKLRIDKVNIKLTNELCDMIKSFQKIIDVFYIKRYNQE